MKYLTLQRLLETVADEPYFVSQLNDPDALSHPMEALTDLAKFIKHNCSQWMKQSGGTPVYRGYTNRRQGGYKWRPQDSIMIAPVRGDRKPMDSSPKFHDYMNAEIQKLGLVANRSNSAFVTGDRHVAENFGDLYIAIPIGDFKYTWSPEIDDPANQAAGTSDGMPLTLTNPIKDLFDSLGTNRDVSVFSPRIQFMHAAFMQDPLIKKIVELSMDPDHWNKNVDDDFLQHKDADDKFKLDNILSCLGDIGSGTNSRYCDIVNRDGWTMAQLRAVCDKINEDTLEKFTMWQGDDGSLPQAIKSDNEIMVHASHLLLLSDTLWDDVRSFL